jgi:hypothetical protein
MLRIKLVERMEYRNAFLLVGRRGRINSQFVGPSVATAVYHALSMRARWLQPFVGRALPPVACVQQTDRTNQTNAEGVVPLGIVARLQRAAVFLSLYPGWRGCAADPGLGCETPSALDLASMLNTVMPFKDSNADGAGF